MIKLSDKLPLRKQLYDLYQALGWNDYLKLDSEQLVTAIENSWYVLSAYRDDELIATGRVISDGVINAYICGLGVLPEYQRRGLGTKILNLLVEQCQKHNLHVQLLCDEEHLSYYRANGFIPFTIGMKKE